MFQYSARPDLLKDRVILVTGAGRGIGAAAAKTFAAHGATVLLLGKTEVPERGLRRHRGRRPSAAAVIPFNLETAQPRSSRNWRQPWRTSSAASTACCITLRSSVRARRCNRFPGRTSCA